MKVPVSGCAIVLFCLDIYMISAQIEVLHLKIGTYTFESSAPNGCGNFGCVHKAQKIGGPSKSPTFVAIKIANAEVNPNRPVASLPLQYEKAIYVNLNLEYNSSRSNARPKGFPVFYDYGLHNLKEFIAIEFIGDDISKRKKPFSLKESLILFEQLLERLKYIHSRGLVHSDIKPQNLAFIDGILYIYDFGLTMPFMNDGTQFRLYSQGQKGTDMYTSVRANKTFDAQLYPRDDLETASLLISEIVSHESMPWARDLTILFVLQTKLKTPLSTLFPNCLPALVFYAEYVRRLPPYARIDYDLLQNIINEAKLSHDIPLDAKVDATTVDIIPEGHSGKRPQNSSPRSTSLDWSPSTNPSIRDRPEVLSSSSSTLMGFDLVNPLDTDDIKNAKYGGPVIEKLLRPSPELLSEREHLGPCQFKKNAGYYSIVENFEKVTTIYAKGIKYLLDGNLVANDKYTHIQVYEVNRLGHTFCIRIGQRDEATGFANVLQNEKLIQEIMESRMKTKVEAKEEWPFGVPVPIAHGYQARRDYTITQLPEGEPLSTKKNVSNKMIIQMGLEILEIIEFFHIQLGMVLVHISKDSFWVSRFGRQRRIVWRGVAQSFHLGAVKANFEEVDPYQSKRCMAIGAHEGKDYAPAYDVESLGWMIYLLLTLQKKPDPHSESPPDDLRRIKKDVLATYEKTADALLAFIRYANGLNGFDPIDYEFLKDLLRSHPDHDPNFDWVQEEVAASNANSIMNLSYHYNNFKYYLNTATVVKNAILGSNIQASPSPSVR